MTDALIIFVKNPVLGKVKTRLAKDIGDSAALEVYHSLLQHTQKITKTLEVNKLLFYSDFIDENDIWSTNRFQKLIQLGQNLGDRIKYAFQKAFDLGNDRIIIIGSDCFAINAQIIEQAFQKLSTFDVVIGPAEDGGYYLLGMKTFHPAMFQNKVWSSEHVFADTVKDCQKLGLSVYQLPVLSDVDTIDDLKKHNIKTRS